MTIFVYLDQAQNYRSTANVPVFVKWIAGHGTYKVTQLAPASTSMAVTTLASRSARRGTGSTRVSRPF